jgi:hypothetical protein
VKLEDEDVPLGLIKLDEVKTADESTKYMVTDAILLMAAAGIILMIAEKRRKKKERG